MALQVGQGLEVALKQGDIKGRWAVCGFSGCIAPLRVIYRIFGMGARFFSFAFAVSAEFSVSIFAIAIAFAVAVAFRFRLIVIIRDVTASYKSPLSLPKTSAPKPGAPGLWRTLWDIRPLVSPYI
jgi:hypothetical protein